MTEATVLGDRYELVDPLGSGGMSVVWRARDQVLGRHVAVKLLAGRLAGEADARERIRAEARAAAVLSHPNVAQVYDYGEWDYDGRCLPYVVMELISGTTLQQRVEAGPMSARFAMRTAAEVAAALAAAHAEGLVHRDVKPANVMITQQGAKVVDFGIAAAISPSGSGEPIEELYGTPAYLAPERLIDDAVEPASDVYALGVLLYRLLSGESPWSAESTTQMLAAHIYIEPDPLPPLPGVPGYVVDLCNRCLDKDPTQRPSAREAAALLAQGAGLRVITDDGPGGSDVTGIRSLIIESEEMDRAESADGAMADAGPAASPPPILRAGGGPVTDHRAGSAGTSGVGRDEGAGVRTGAGSPMPDSRRRRLWAVAAAAVLVAALAVVWLLLPADHQGDRAPAAFATEPSRAAGQPSPANAATPGLSSPAPQLGRPVPDGPGQGSAGGVTSTATVIPAPIGPVPTSGAQPGGPRPEPTSTSESPDPVPTTAEPPERTFTSVGGTVRATCTGPSTARLLSWSAIRPFRVDQVDPGPAATTAVTFQHGNRLVRMTVSCLVGIPSANTDED